MHNAIPLAVAALIAAGIIVIGCFYFVAPERILGRKEELDCLVL
jgi:hypothetical protein